MTELKHRNNVVPFTGPPSVELETAAAKWLTLLNSGRSTMADLVAFEIWKSESPNHQHTYRELERVWNDLGALAGVRAIASTRRNSQPAARRLWTLKVGAWAACVAAMLLGAQASVQYLHAWRHDYHTRPGQIRTFVLADGSTASLKGDTAIDLHISKAGARKVELVRGEAFFEVRHNPARPFVVQSGVGVIEDLGTGFSVKRYGEAGSVSVEHGSVQVTAAGRSDVLTDGEGIQFNAYNLSQKSHVDPDTISPWRRGLYFAKDEPLGKVLDELDAYYPGKIIVLDRKLRAQPINAVVQLSRIDAWLGALSKIHGVSIHRIGPIVLVSSNKS